MQIYLGIGTNLGEREKNLKKAIDLLASKVKIEQFSKIYESEPVGVKDQPWFLNMCVCGETDLSAKDLLGFCKEIEDEMGREVGEKWGPRLIDIDILLYGDLVLYEEVLPLIIPHLQLHKRKFVLMPLDEIAGEVLHPKLKKTINELLNSCDDVSIVRLRKK